LHPRGIGRRRTSLVDASRLGLGDAFELPLLAQVSFELSEHAEHIEERLAGRGAGLDYVDAGKQVGDKHHLKVFASEDIAEMWFEENDPEGVAFEYEILE